MGGYVSCLEGWSQKKFFNVKKVSRVLLRMAKGMPNFKNFFENGHFAEREDEPDGREYV
jgi:hypothetical protein